MEKAREYWFVRLDSKEITDKDLVYPIKLKGIVLTQPPIQCLIVNPQHKHLIPHINKNYNTQSGMFIGLIDMIFFFEKDDYVNFVFMYGWKIDMSKYYNFSDLTMLVKNK